MSNGNTTRTRPPRPHRGRRRGSTPSGVREARQEGCGAWFLQFIPDPPQLVQGNITVTRENGAREQHRRWSLDNVVYFYPNLDNECQGYEFMQFAKRTVSVLNPDGTDSGRVVRRLSHDWQPDVEGWKDRAVKKFLDLGEIIYNGDRVHDVNPKGRRRDDGPGFSYPFGHPPKNRKFCWEFKLYVVCDGGAKVVGKLEFSFCIIVGADGAPRLEFPAEGEEGSPSRQDICCNVDESFMEWIDQWHAHTPLSGLPREPGERRQELRQMRSLVDESMKTRRSFRPLFPPKPDLPDRDGGEVTMGIRHMVRELGSTEVVFVSGSATEDNDGKGAKGGKRRK